jgi:hypothetical protein
LVKKDEHFVHRDIHDSGDSQNYSMLKTSIAAEYQAGLLLHFILATSERMRDVNGSGKRGKKEEKGAEEGKESRTLEREAIKKRKAPIKRVADKLGYRIIMVTLIIYGAKPPVGSRFALAMNVVPPLYKPWKHL